MINLKPVDLTDLTENNLPKVNEDSTYVALVRLGSYGYPQIVSGRFSKVWFGYSFHIGTHMLQWSSSGHDAKNYIALWEVDIDLEPYYKPEPPRVNKYDDYYDCCGCCGSCSQCGRC